MSAAQTTPPAGQADYYTDLAVGEILRRTRVHYGQTLDDAANFIRIRATQLEAIENNHLDLLPGRTYAIGYIRTYAEYLGLDGEKMVTLFKQQAGGKTAKPELHFPVPASESKAPNLYVVFGSLAVLALVIGVWVALSAVGKARDKSIAEIPSVPADMRVTETPAASVAPATSIVATAPAAQPATAPSLNSASPATPALSVQAALAAATVPQAAATPTASSPPAPAKKEIVITIRDRSWVEVRDKQGKPLLSRILKPGEVFIVPESNYGLRLDTGNAGGIDLTVNGEPYPALGKQGDILRGFILDGNKMAQKVAPTPGTSIKRQ